MYKISANSIGEIMKKILVLSLSFLFAQGIANAYIDGNRTSDIDVLRSMGYSESALRVVDTTRAMHSGIIGNYQRYYSPKKKGAYTILKEYVDPIQEDAQFGEHEINFTNSWLGDEPPNALRYVENAPVENL